MKKNKLFIILIAISIFVFLPINIYAEKNLGKDTGKFDLIADRMYSAFAGDSYFNLIKGHYYVKWLQDNNGNQKPRIVYCSDFETPFDYYEDYESKGVDDIGIQYIIKNGFTGNEVSGQSFHYSTNDNCSNTECQSLLNINTNYPKANSPWYVNYWLTQMAIWVYQGQNSESMANVRSLLNSSNITENQRIVKELVAGANEIKNNSSNFTTVDPKMSISDSNLELDGDYYYSKLITVTGVGDTFSVSVSNNNYEIVDSSKNVKTNFNKNDKFYVRILKSKITKSEDVNVVVSTSGATYANKYRSSAVTQQLSAYNYTSVNSRTTTLKLSVSYEKKCDLNAVIIDVATNEKVCGGTILIQDENGNIIKDSNGNEIGRVSLNSDNCEVKLSLPDGKYRAVQDSSLDSYIKDENAYEINFETKCPTDIEFKNEKLYKIRILKINGSEDNPLEGASLKLEDSEGNIIKEFVSTKEEQVIENLHAGTYYLSEIVAPNGYVINNERLEIKVNADNDNKLFTFNNDEIIVPKTDLNTVLIEISVILGLVGGYIVYYSRKKVNC